MSRYPDRNEDPYRRNEDPYRRNEDPYRRNEDPYRRNDDQHRKNDDAYRRNDEPYRRNNDPYRRGEDPYSRSKEDPYRRVDDRYRRPDDGARGSRVFGDDQYRRTPQDGYVARSVGDGFRTDSYKGSAETGGYGFRRPDPVIYEVDHLVTFDISPKLGMRNHKDGLERLKHMQMTSGIWTMRYLLSVDDREIVITEKASRKELASFPISRVHDPVNITSNDPQEIYNNILIFVVEGEGSRTASEMHIFQSIGKPGQELIDDIEAARIGKFPRPVKEKPERRPSPSPEPEKPPEKPPATKIEDAHPSTNGRPNSASSNNTVMEATENNVEMLNQCFDSIETFVADLQHAAHAQKNLDVARTNGTVDEKEIQSLVNKARPPPAREFIDTFQKFKFALNLLPKLRYVLKDPNAQELTHMLFAPLAVVVDASRDPQGKPKLASTVTSPLLNRDTCILLDKSLHSSEVQLWRLLGDSWNIPAELWKGPPPPPYIPQFTGSSKSPRAGPVQNGSGPQSSGQVRAGEPSVPKSQSATSIDPVQEEFLRSLKARNAKVYKIIQGRASRNVKELTVVEGEYVEVLEDTKRWWKVSNRSGDSGFIPSTIVSKVE